MMLETKRLLLRPWEESDAEACYQYAKDDRVGPIAGWPVHTSVEHSRQVIREVLAAPETYAVVLKETGLPVGSIGLHRNDLAEKDDEMELGYWLGVPYWGQGIVPEAAREMLRHAFIDLQLARVWCAYYDGNERSRRVQEKLGFRFQWTTEDAPVPQMGETRRGHVNLLRKEEWLAGREYLDIVDESGRPTGKTVSRDEAHRKGVLHRTAHVWVVRPKSGGYDILLQKRSEEKESFPGMFDTSSAGHIPAGVEPLPSAIRELSEELGIDAKPEELRLAGTFRIRYEKEFHGRMFRDNEVTTVFVYDRPVDIRVLRLQKSEVSEVRWFDLEAVWTEIRNSRARFCVPAGGLKLLREHLMGEGRRRLSTQEGGRFL